MTEHHLSYYKDQIRSTAKNLQREIMIRNGIEVNPTRGDQIKPIPVFESSCCSLLKFTNEMYPTETVWMGRGTSTDFLHAYIIKYVKDSRKSARIVVTENENYCLARFFAAKELMHCHIAENGLPASTKTAHEANELLNSLALGISFDNQTMVDEVAWLGAAEFLIPETWISFLKVILSRIRTNFPQHDAFLHLAQLLRVPAALVAYKLK